MLGDRLYVTPHSTLHVFQTLLPSIFPLLLTIVLQFLSLHSLLHTLHSLHSLHSTLYTEAQTICSCNHSSVSLLIPLQTLLFRTPTNAARRWASEFLHFPTFSACFGGFSCIVYCFFPTFFLAFFHFPPFSPCLQRFSFVFSYLFPVIPPFTFPFCAIALHFPPAVNDCPSVSFTALLTAHFTLFTLFTLYPLHRSPNHLQLQSFLSITSHPLANSLVPNPNERGTPLSFGVPPFSYVFHLLWRIFLHCLLFFSYLFPRIPPVSSIFPPFSTICLHFLTFFSYFFPGIPPFFPIFLYFHPVLNDFPSFSVSSIFLHFPPVFNDVPSFSVIFSYLFPSIPQFFSIFPLFSTIFLPFLSFFPTFFLAFLFSPFSLCFQRFSFVFFLPFSCHSSIFLHFPPVFNDFPSFSRFFPTFSWHSSIFFFPVIPPFSSVFPPLWRIFLPFLSFFFLPFSWHSCIFPLFSMIFLRFFPTFFLYDFPSFSFICQRT